MKKNNFEEFMMDATAKAFLDDTQFILFGDGGFAKEVKWLMQTTGIKNIEQKHYISYLKYYDNPMLVIGIGDPSLKEKIYSDYKDYPFPSIISNDFIKGKVEVGDGNIICAGNIWTTDIIVGDCNAFNLGCTVGHDVKIGNYNQINPSVNISGKVTIGNKCLIGTGVQILENITIGNNITIGAGAVVTKDLIESGTYVGIPAKKII